MLARTVALLSAFCVIAAYAHADVTSRDPESIVKVMQASGYRASLGKTKSGRPMIESTASGSKFTVFFFGCRNDSECNQIQIWSGFASKVKPTFEQVNKWNQDKSFTKAMVDKDGDPELALELWLADPVSDAYFKKMLDLWDGSLGDFKKEMVK